jgi:hypothetical protein
MNRSSGEQARPIQRSYNPKSGRQFSVVIGLPPGLKNFSSKLPRFWNCVKDMIVEFQF